MVQYKLKVHVVNRKQFFSIQQSAAQISKRPEFLDPQLFEFRLKLNAKSSDLILFCAKEAQRRYEMFERVTSHALSLYDKDFCYLSPEDRVEAVLDPDDVCYLLVENIQQMSPDLKRSANTDNSSTASNDTPSSKSPEAVPQQGSSQSNAPPSKRQVLSSKENNAPKELPLRDAQTVVQDTSSPSQSSSELQSVRSPARNAEGAKQVSRSKATMAGRQARKSQEPTRDEEPMRGTEALQSSSILPTANGALETSSPSTAKGRRRTSKVSKASTTKNGPKDQTASSAAPPTDSAPVNLPPSNSGNELFGVQRASLNGTSAANGPDALPGITSENSNTNFSAEELTSTSDPGASSDSLSKSSQTRGSPGGSIPETLQVAGSETPATAAVTAKANAKVLSPVRPINPAPDSETINEHRDQVESSDDEEEEEEEEEDTSRRRRQRLSRAKEVTASRSFKAAASSLDKTAAGNKGPAVRATHQPTAKELPAQRPVNEGPPEAESIQKPAKRKGKQPTVKQSGAQISTAQLEKGEGPKAHEDAQDHVPGLGGFASLANVRPSVHDGARKTPGPLDVLDDTQSSEEESDSSASGGSSDDSGEDSDESVEPPNSQKRKRRGGALATLRR